MRVCMHTGSEADLVGSDTCGVCVYACLHGTLSVQLLACVRARLPECKLSDAYACVPLKCEWLRACR